MAEPTFFHEMSANLNHGPIVIGTGLAGLMTALSLAPLPVILIGTGEKGSSDLAQGGIAAAVGESDAPGSHALDTIQASSGLCDEDIVDIVTGLGPDRIAQLEKLGVVFDRAEDGQTRLLGREAAHSADRILHCNGDGTGAAVTAALWERVREADHIQILSPAVAEQLVRQDDRITGVEVMTPSGRHVLYSRAVILATGGIGQLFSRTTNPETVSGQGLGMALRAGAAAADLEFVQFHPTAIRAEGLNPLPLATEALRGAGARLVDGRGKYFMDTVHLDAELAPRDIVARAVFREDQASGAFLDARQAVGTEFPKKFPTVYKLCRAAGIDPVRDLIPVAPAAHYHMGGIAVDSKGRSSLTGLWACGEVACTGLHGANRLASNSLLEALVFAPLIAEDVKAQAGSDVIPADISKLLIGKNKTILMPVEDKLKSSMYVNLGVVRQERGLAQLIEQLEDWDPVSQQHLNQRAAALAIAKAALARRESRGGHYRSDHPMCRERYNKRGLPHEGHMSKVNEVSYV